MSEENSNFITLTDESGEESQFELISVVNHEGSDYAVLAPVDEAEDENGECEVVILMIRQDENGDDELVTVEDDALLDQVFDEFLKQEDEEDGEDAE